MTKQRDRRWILLLLIALLLTACTPAEPTPTEVDPNQPIELQMAGWGFDHRVEWLLEAFHASQDKYVITVKDYYRESAHVNSDGSSYVPSDELDAAVMRMNMEFATGDRPDLFCLAGGADGVTLSYAGVLMDLNPLIDNDPTLDRADYHPTLWELMEVDGGLYELPTAFQLMGIVAPTSVVGDRTGWTMEEYLALEQQAGEPLLKYGFEYMLSGWVCYGLADFIDTDAGTCAFDSPAFQTYLTSWKSMDEKLDAFEGTAYYPVYDRAVNRIGMWMREKHQWQMDYGLTPALLGYPQPEAHPPCADTNLPYKFGIAADTQQLDGCWAFIRFVLSEEIQQQIADRNALPVMNSVMEDQFARAMLPGSDPTSLAHGTKKQDGSEEPLDPLTQEEVDHLRELIYGIDTVAFNALDVELILREELQPYFAGDKSMEETSDILQERVGLFLAERRQGLLRMEAEPVLPDFETLPDEPAVESSGPREPRYPDAGYTMEDGILYVGEERYPLNARILDLDVTFDDYRFLAELTELNTLDISADVLAEIDLSLLTELPYLDWLTLHFGGVETMVDLSPLKDCPSLTALHLYAAHYNMEGLEEVTQLEELYLTFCQYESNEFLRDMDQLVDLVIADDESPDIVPLLLYRLPKLERLACFISYGQDELLKSVYPECEFTFWPREVKTGD